ncbi:MAG TPA: methionyl-tRNA formyltransferase [Anaerolineae bacterium]|nr:methionyl-tRNA formyltransferase [Anaerolineae bacterium]
MTRIIFMGTPDFSVPTLAALVQGGYDLVAVVTQPDRPAGRGRKLELSPVKAFALQHSLPILQLPTLKAPEAVAELAGLRPDVIVVAAFGQILRPAVLDLPPHGCINVHASLLPRWRGAAPVQAAILAGDQVTGSTIMRMDVGMDTGPILAQAALAIQPDDSGGSLLARLAQQGADLLSETLPRWLAGQITPQPQDASLAALCRPLRKEQGLIDWTRPAAEIALAVRAFNPWPAASTAWQGQQLRVLQAEALPDRAGEEPGRVMQIDGAIVVATGDRLLRLEQVQLAGRAAMAAVDFARGQRNFAGSRLG